MAAPASSMSEVANMSDSQPLSLVTDDLARLLPTCQRCRRLRRKCDTQLPACRLCQKAKAECTFFDHALQQQLPRAYVQSLLTRLDRLKSVQQAVGGPSAVHQAPSTPIGRTIHPIPLPTPDISSPPGQTTFDKHFVVRNANPTCWQYFGSSSFLALTVEVLVHAQARLGTLTHDENYCGSDFHLNAAVEEQVPGMREPPDRAAIEKHVAFYMASSNAARAFIDEDMITHDIEGYLASQGTDVRRLVSYQAHQFFRISMICAISCATKARHQPSLAVLSMQFYAEALRCVEEVTSDVSVESLIALLLLILFAMFYPRKGDLWKLLDFTCRLSVELGLHTERDTAFLAEKSRVRRRQIFWALYSLERSFGQHFGRPSDLPEDIITTEYPSTLDSLPVADHAMFQAIAMSHYSRLTYLRSEIYREAYLPALMPNLPKLWYQRKYENILTWRGELPQFYDFIGVGSITCDIAFQSSTCFLFQPLLLWALAHDQMSKLEDVPQDFPCDSYWAACQMIEIYIKIFRGSEGSPYGMYPITVNSAMHIQTATMTILAFCLLAMSGRFHMNSWRPEPFRQEPTSISFENFNDISGSCFILLTKCAEKWPGMLGMLDIYQSLSKQILPIILRNRSV